MQFLAQFGSLLVLVAKVTVGAHVRGDEDMPVYEATEGAQEVQGGKSRRDSLSASATWASYLDASAERMRASSSFARIGTYCRSLFSWATW